MARQNPYAISKDELRREIAAYQRRIRATEAQQRHRERSGASVSESRRRPSRCSERLAEMLFLLATRLAERPNFARYTYDLAADAMPSLLRAAAKFDLSRKGPGGEPCSPFAYLTTTCWYSFLATIRKGNARGITAATGQPLEVSSLPTLLLGSFSAESLSAALRERHGGFHQPEA